MSFVYNSLIPELMVADLNQSLAFYVTLCGFKIAYQRDEERFVFLSFEGSQLMLEKMPKQPSQKLGVGVNLSIACADVAALYHQLMQADYPIHRTLETKTFRVNDGFVSSKEFSVLDPDGYYLRFCD